MVSVWRSAGPIPLSSTVGRVSFYRYASPLRCDHLFSAIERSIENVGRAVWEIPRNRLIFKARSAPAHVWVIAEGEARLIFPVNARRAAAYSRLTAPYELVGLTETLADLPYNASLQTVSACRCLTVSRPELIRLLTVDALLRDELILTVASGLA